MCVCVCVNTWILHTWMGWDTPTYVVKHEDVCDIFGSFGILENNGKHTSNILTWELRNAPWKWPQSKAMHSIVHRCVCVNLIKTGFLSFKTSCIWVHILIWRYLKSAPVLWKRGSLPCTKSAPLHHSQPFPTFANDWIRSGNQVMPKDFGRTRCGRKLHPLPPGRSSSWVVVGPCWAGCALILHGGGTNLLILNDPQTFFHQHEGSQLSHAIPEVWFFRSSKCFDHDPFEFLILAMHFFLAISQWLDGRAPRPERSVLPARELIFAALSDSGQIQQITEDQDQQNHMGLPPLEKCGSGKKHPEISRNHCFQELKEYWNLWHTWTVLYNTSDPTEAWKALPTHLFQPILDLV